MVFGKLSAQQIERFIGEAAQDGPRILFTRHARLRMLQRHVSRAMVRDVLRRGRLARVPEPNLRFGSLECRMERYVAGRQIAVVVALANDNPFVLVVTVINV